VSQTSEIEDDTTIIRISYHNIINSMIEMLEELG
jgi:hypothetical protein